MAMNGFKKKIPDLAPDQGGRPRHAGDSLTLGDSTCSIPFTVGVVSDKLVLVSGRNVGPGWRQRAGAVMLNVWMIQILSCFASVHHNDGSETKAVIEVFTRVIH